MGAGAGEPQLGNHGYYDLRVPKDHAGNARFDRLEMGAAPISPQYQHLLHALDIQKETLINHPEVAVYLKLAKEAGMETPFGHKLGANEAADSDAQQAYLVALAGLSASGAMMGRKVVLGAVDGQGEWQYAPAQHWLQIYAEQLNNGINPESIEYLYPDFDAAMERFEKTAKTTASYQALEKEGVIYTSGGKKRLNLLAAVDADGNIKAGLDKPLHDLRMYAGRGVAKKIFVSAFTAILEAQKRGVIPGTSGHTIYTWDLVHNMAARYDAVSKTAGAEEVTKRLEEIATKIAEIGANGSVDAGTKDALKALQAEAEQLHAEIGPSELKGAVAQLMKQPLIGIKPSGGNDLPTPDDVKAALAKISKASAGINKLASVVGIDADPHDVEGTIEKLIKAYDSHLMKYEGGGGGTSELWSDRTIDLFVMEASGRRLTSKQAHRLHAIVNEMKKDNIDVGVVRAGIRQLVEMAADNDVAGWASVSGPFYRAINSLDNSVKDAMGAAVKHYRAASDIARNPSLVTQGYVNLVATGNVLKTEELEYFPTVIQSVSHIQSKDEEFTTRVFVGCVHFAEMAVLRLAGGNGADVKFGSAFTKTDFGFADNPAKLWDHSDAGCRSMHMPRVRPTDSTMYAVMNATCRQMVTMMGNTVAWGAILRTLAMKDKADQIDNVTEYFRFSRHANKSKKDDVYVTVLGTDPATAVTAFHTAIKGPAAGFDGTSPFKVLTAPDISALVEDGNRIKIGKLNDFAHFAEFYKAAAAAGVATDIRLETNNGIATAHKVNAQYEAYKKAAKARFLSEYGAGLSGVSPANAEELATKLTEAAALSGSQLYTLFEDFMPDRNAFDEETKGVVGDFVNMTAPCYFHDHPWGAAFYMASITTVNGANNFAEDTGSLWACRHPEAWAAKDRMDRAIYKVRPALSLAPLATFMEAVARNGHDDTMPRGVLLDNGVKAMDEFFEEIEKPINTSKIQTFAPMRAETVSMQVAKRVLPRKAFAKRAKAIGKHSTAMKKHLLSSLRAAHSANMGRVAVNTTRGHMVDGTAVPAEWQVWGMVPGAADALVTQDKAPGGAAKFNVVKNPRERCFGTLIGLEAGIARVMLNPALANPILG